MDLVLDVGNSGIKAGLFDEEGLLRTFRIESDPSASRSAYRHSLRAHLEKASVERCALLSVVPSLTDRIAEALRQETLLRPLRLTAHMRAPVRPAYRSLETLGVDRLAAAAGGYLRVRRTDEENGGGDSAPGPLVVVDAGTAITTEVVEADGTYLGGSIAAGPDLTMEALAGRTAQLKTVELAPPEHPIGRTTAESMRAGILFGAADAVDGALDRYESHLGRPPIVLLTGGGAGRLSPLIDRDHEIVPHLVLEGGRSMLAANE